MSRDTNLQNFGNQGIPGASGHCSSLTAGCFSPLGVDKKSNPHMPCVSWHGIVVGEQHFEYGRLIMSSRGDRSRIQIQNRRKGGKEA